MGQWGKDIQAETWFQVREQDVHKNLQEHHQRKRHQRLKPWAGDLTEELKDHWGSPTWLQGGGRGSSSGGCPVIKDLNAIIVHACSQSCLTPWTWGSPPGSSVHGILQARILEWVTISYSRGSSQPRDRTYVSCGSCTGRWIVYHLSHVLLTKYNFLSNLISLAAITKYHRLGGFSSRHFSLLAGQYTPCSWTLGGPSGL